MDSTWTKFTPRPKSSEPQKSAARIAGLTLGHDARAHDLPEFKTLLLNSIDWVKK